MNILIIGNSAAGTAAIEAIRSRDRRSTIVQLTDEGPALYSRCLLSYYLAGSLPRERLLYRDPDFHQRMGVCLHAGTRAVELDAARQRVVCEDGSEHPFDKLLIATGASATLPEHLAAGIRGVCVLRTVDDAERIREQAGAARRAVVLGGGLIGMKAACALRACGLATTVVVRSRRVLSQMADDGAARIIEGRLRENGIEVVTGTDLTAVQSRDGRLAGVETDGGGAIPCELLIVAKGVRPNIALLRGTGIKTNAGIETGPSMQTTRDNIFAAGDAAEAFDITTGARGLNALWTCAVQQGRIAGLAIAGADAAYDGAVGMNSLDICNTPLLSYGVTAPRETGRYQVLVREQPARGVYKKIVLEDGRVKGVILLGRIDNGGVLLSLIRQRTDVSGFAEELLDDGFTFAKLAGCAGPAVLDQYHHSSM